MKFERIKIHSVICSSTALQVYSIVTVWLEYKVVQNSQVIRIQSVYKIILVKGSTLKDTKGLLIQ